MTYDEDRAMTRYLRVKRVIDNASNKLFTVLDQELVDAMAEPPKPEWPTDETMDRLGEIYDQYEASAVSRVVVGEILAETDPIIKAAVECTKDPTPANRVALGNAVRNAVIDAGLLQ